MKSSLNMMLLSVAGLLAFAATARAAEVGVMPAEEMECRYENGNTEPPPVVPVQFQQLPVVQDKSGDPKKSGTAE